MNTYITFMFWIGCFDVFLRSVCLISKHPRRVEYGVGLDTFALIAAIVMLAWVSFLKFGA